MTAARTALVDRLRPLVAAESVTREVSMFGGRAIMVNDKMIVCAQKDGGLLVRIDARRHHDLLGRPGARQAVMGPDRDMGPGWIEVDAATIADDRTLEAWVGVAMEYNRAITEG